MEPAVTAAEDPLRLRILVELAEALRGLPADTRPSQLPRHANYRVFELIVAYEAALMPWHMLSSDSLDRFSLPRSRRHYADMGVDCASPCLATVAQAKWHGPQTSVTFREMGTFFTMAAILGASRRLLYRTAGSPVAALAMRAPGVEHVEVPDERIDELCYEALRRFGPAAQPSPTEAESEESTLSTVDDEWLTGYLESLTIDEGTVAAAEPAEEPTEVPDTGATLASIDEELIAELEASVSAPQSLDAYLEDLIENWPGIAEPVAVVTTAVRALRPYQREAVAACLAALETKKTARLALPCGSGKTAIIAELVRTWLAGDAVDPILVAVPSRLLLEQVRDELIAWGVTERVGLAGDGYTLADWDQPRMIIAVYNSVHKLTARRFSRVVVDEAHRVFAEYATEDDDESADEGNAEDEAVAASGRVHATALRSLVADATVLLSASLPHEGVDYSVSLQALIEQGYLCDYHVVIPVLTEGSDRVSALVDLLQVHPEWTRVMAYCNRLSAAEAFAAACNSADIPAVWFSGKTSRAERKRILTAAEAGVYRVVATVNTLSEGVNIPWADCALFVEPRSGQVNVQQCTGRVLRVCAARGKRLAAVVLPTTSEERELGRFLRAMANIDPRLLAAVRARSMGRVSIEVIGSDAVAAPIVSELQWTAEYDRFGRLLNPDVVWRSKYELLVEFVEQYTKIPTQSDTYRGVRLGSWVCTQRLARQGKSFSLITLERIKALEAVQGWFWESSYDNTWMKKYRLLADYVAEHKSLPDHFEIYKGYHLGKWVSRQRGARKGTVTCSMTPQRIAAMEAIDGWFWETDRDAEWMRKYELLAAHVSETGRLPKQSTVYRGVKLGQWCATQRLARKGKGSSTLDTARITALETIEGWRW